MKEKMFIKIELTPKDIIDVVKEKFDLSEDAKFDFIAQNISSNDYMDRGGFSTPIFTRLEITDKISKKKIQKKKSIMEGIINGQSLA